MTIAYARVPEDRIAVVIGREGRTRSEIARRTGTQLTIDAEEGEVEIQGPETDPMAVLKARDIVLAIGRGFSPERAFRLLAEDCFFGVVEIKPISRQHDKAGLRRVRSRLIGTEGKARRLVEELSGASMSVYGSTVGLIGNERQLDHATRAVELLLRGSEHATVFHMLSRLRREEALEEALAPPPLPGDDPG
ncbi:MAG: KH domain-containing protein [Thermoplasmata archaeon]